MQLSCFAEVATTLSFSRAAENLHVSQPTVSHQIKALEDELGCALLTRSTRTVRLTEDGMVFLGYAYEILDLEARSRAQLAQGGSGSTEHTIKIGVHDGLEGQLVVPALRTLHAADPDFDPVLRMGPASSLRDMLENGSIDVVPEYRDPAEAPSNATTLLRLADLPVVCVSARDHPLASRAGGPPCVEDLLRAGRIAVGDPHHCAEALVRAQRQIAMRVDTPQVMMGANVEVCLALARAGVAFTLLPDIPAARQPDLVAIPVEGLAPIAFGVRVRHGRRPALVNAFVKALADELASS